MSNDAKGFAIAVVAILMVVAFVVGGAVIAGPEKCKDHIPAHGGCWHADARLVVEDRVAVCRCEVAK